jgi:23S rRNA pseudouridine2457 synthase
MLSQFVSQDKKQQKKRFLGELGDFEDGMMAVGRLDEKSEGLLILTDDGNLSNTINKSVLWDKEYYAQLDGKITDEAISRLSKGVKIGFEGKKYLTKSCVVKHIVPPELPQTNQKIRDDRHGPTSWISITLTEGKFRQVRRMCSAVGYPVLRLARIRIGKFAMDRLKGQQVVQLDNEELLSDNNQQSFNPS